MRRPTPLVADSYGPATKPDLIAADTSAAPALSVKTPHAPATKKVDCGCLRVATISNSSPRSPDLRRRRRRPLLLPSPTPLVAASAAAAAAPPPLLPDRFHPTPPHMVVPSAAASRD
ncbi:hypothetical protein ABZP36_030823 [Zizania latifolia]